MAIGVSGIVVAKLGISPSLETDNVEQVIVKDRRVATTNHQRLVHSGLGMGQAVLVLEGPGKTGAVLGLIAVLIGILVIVSV